MLLCAEYVLPITSEPIEAGCVLVRGGKIADVGPADVLRARYADEEVRDFGQAAIIPGFVNVHSHIEFSVLRGMISDKPYAEWLEAVDAMGSTLNAATLYDSALVGGLEMLADGVTCLGTTTQSESVVRAMNDLGLRGTIYREVSAMDASRIDFAMRQAAADIDAWAARVDSGKIEIGIASGALHMCHPKVFGRVAQYAGDTMPVAIHIAGSREEYNFVRNGRTPFSVDAMDRHAYVEVPPWLPTGATPVNYALNWGAFYCGRPLAIHGVHVNDDDIQQLRQYNVSIAFCPRTNAFLGMGVAPLSEYMKAGMHVGIGTDSPAATDSSDMFAEMRTACQVQRSVNASHFLTSHEALEMATIGGARALGVDHRIGSLEVGKRADVVAVDLSGSRAMPTNNVEAAVVTTASSANVCMTMIGGDILYDKGSWNVNVEVAPSITNLIRTRTNLRAQF